MQIIDYKAGDTIISEGEDGDTAFLVVSGSVEVSVGREAKVLCTLDRGEVFGEMSLIDPGPRSATVKALTDTKCLVTSFDEFAASIQSNPEDAILFLKTLVRRLRQMNARIAETDPAKRGLRRIFGDLQKSLKPQGDDDPLLHWSIYSI